MKPTPSKPEEKLELEKRIEIAPGINATIKGELIAKGNTVNRSNRQIQEHKPSR
ncbi:hypothetical protein FACS189425_09300 [Clostridia bacterium]|nr:hypothetical protein FACS189425_09300 [Clostridia bacterium]